MHDDDDEEKKKQDKTKKILHKKYLKKEIHQKISTQICIYIKISNCSRLCESKAI